MRLHCPRQQKETITPLYKIMAAAFTVALYTIKFFNQNPFVLVFMTLETLNILHMYVITSNQEVCRLGIKNKAFAFFIGDFLACILREIAAVQLP